MVLHEILLLWNSFVVIMLLSHLHILYGDNINDHWRPFLMSLTTKVYNKFITSAATAKLVATAVIPVASTTTTTYFKDVNNNIISTSTITVDVKQYN
jgi:hypothetical protein